MRRWLYPCIGIASCTVAAASLAPIFSSSSFKPFLPFVFLALILLVAVRFGSIAGVLGTIVAAIIFAAFLFEPTLSLAVRDKAARSNLIWMMIAGSALSELMGSRPTARPSK